MKTLIFPVTKKEAEKSGTSYSSEANKNALFPTQLRELRKEKGVSQETVARDLGVSKSTIGLYETGDTLPDVKTLSDLAKYYGVSADYLAGLSNVRSSNTTLKALCEYTGFSESSLKMIEFFRDCTWEKQDPIETLNLLFSNFSTDDSLGDLILQLDSIRIEYIQTYLPALYAFNSEKEKINPGLNRFDDNFEWTSTLKELYKAVNDARLLIYTMEYRAEKVFRWMLESLESQLTEGNK